MSLRHCEGPFLFQERRLYCTSSSFKDPRVLSVAFPCPASAPYFPLPSAVVLVPIPSQNQASPFLFLP
jgi:hypothetical protein